MKMSNNPKDSQNQTFESAKPRSKVLHSLLVLFGQAYEPEKIELNTRKRPQEIVLALRDNIDSSWSLLSTKEEYRGWVKDNSFGIWWYEPYSRNAAWRPVLYGTIEETADGSTIKAHFDMHPVGIIFALTLLIFLLILIFMSEPVSLKRILVGGVFLLLVLFLLKARSLGRKAAVCRLTELLDKVATSSNR